MYAIEIFVILRTPIKEILFLTIANLFTRQDNTISNYLSRYEKQIDFLAHMWLISYERPFSNSFKQIKFLNAEIGI